MQYSEQQQNKLLTPGNGLPYLLSEKQESNKREGLLQRIHVRTAQKCPSCKGKFHDALNNLVCPICQTVATRMYLEWWFKNKRYYLNGFESYIDAQRKAVQIESEINNYTFKPKEYKDKKGVVNKKYRFSHVYEKWLAQRKLDLARNDIAPAYYPKLKQYGKEFVKFFGDKDIRAINTADIKKFRNSLSSELASKTQKNKLDALHKFFNDLFDDEVLEKIPKFPKIKVQITEPKWITGDIQMKILSCIPVEHKPIIEFLIETGLRPAEVRALKWKDVEQDCIHIRASFSNGVYREITKTKNQWSIPMLKRFREILDRVPRSLKTDFVFWHGNNKSYSEKKVRYIWHDACDKAGVDRIKLYQGTRHSFASQNVNNGVSLELIGAMMGHVNTATTRKYAHLNKITALRKAFER